MSLFKKLYNELEQSPESLSKLSYLVNELYPQTSLKDLDSDELRMLNESIEIHRLTNFENRLSIKQILSLNNKRLLRALDYSKLSQDDVFYLLSNVDCIDSLSLYKIPSQYLEQWSQNNPRYSLFDLLTFRDQVNLLRKLNSMSLFQIYNKTKILKETSLYRHGLNGLIREKVFQFMKFDETFKERYIELIALGQRRMLNPTFQKQFRVVIYLLKTKYDRMLKSNKSKRLNTLTHLSYHRLLNELMEYVNINSKNPKIREMLSDCGLTSTSYTNKKDNNYTQEYKNRHDKTFSHHIESSVMCKFLQSKFYKFKDNEVFNLKFYNSNISKEVLKQILSLHALNLYTFIASSLFTNEFKNEVITEFIDDNFIQMILERHMKANEPIYIDNMTLASMNNSSLLLSSEAKIKVLNYIVKLLANDKEKGEYDKILMTLKDTVINS